MKTVNVTLAPAVIGAIYLGTTAAPELAAALEKAMGMSDPVAIRFRVEELIAAHAAMAQRAAWSGRPLDREAAKALHDAIRVFERERAKSEVRAPEMFA